jgi:restriction system protein
MTHPKVWLVRGGRDGESEEIALDGNMAIIGFHDVDDLSKYASQSYLVDRLRAADPKRSEPRAINRAAQLWAFRETMQPGDTVLMPLKTRPGQIAAGRVTGPYAFRRVGTESRHTRPVSWSGSIPRLKFRQDLLHSLGAFLTVCRITRNEAEARVAAVLDGGEDPGLPAEQATKEAAEPIPQPDEGFDLERAARDEIVRFVRQHFPDHDLARLVEAILNAEGYLTRRSAPGPDGGVDILAARGPLGLDGPTLCVQVKATATSADVNVFRALQGSMTSFQADQGLLVCWSGFTKACTSEARLQTFRIRLWSGDDLVEAAFRTYSRLPAEIQAELPLKQVWALVHEETNAE